MAFIYNKFIKNEEEEYRLKNNSVDIQNEIKSNYNIISDDNIRNYNEIDVLIIQIISKIVIVMELS